MAQTDPDLPTIEELEKLASERVPLPGDDLLVKVGDYSVNHRFKQIKYGLVGLIAICLVGGGLSVLQLMSHRPQPPAAKADKTQTKVVALVGNAVQNDSQLYRQATDDPAKSAYTLVDKAGNQVAQATQSAGLQMVSSLGADKFLLSESQGGELKYAVLSPEGFKPVDLVPASLGTAAGTKTFSSVSSFGDDKVIYQYCDNSDLNTYKCDLRTFDAVSGKETVAPFATGPRSYRPRLLALSNDRRQAYLIGMTDTDREALKAKILNAGKNTAELANLKYDQRIITLDLSTQTVTNARKVEVYYNRTNKFWLSPNGRYLVYSAQGSDGVLDYVDVNKGAASKIKLPAADDTTQPWSAATTTADPRFSSDGRYMAYVTYDTRFSNKLESLGLIDLQTRTTRELAKQPNDGTGVTNYFSNLQWRGQQLEFRAGRDNQRFDLATSTIQPLDNRFGLLLGNADNAD